MIRILLICFASVLCGSSWEQFKDETISVDLPHIFGSCSKEKADKLMEFVKKNRPLICIEIGSFGGASTYPIARAMSYFGPSAFYAVDAWNLDACFEGYEMSDPNVLEIKKMKIDMDGARRHLLFILENRQLRSICFPLHLRSDEAVKLFSDETVDMVYLDGNNSPEGSLKDAILYLPKVKKGGSIWLNDADRPTKVKTVSFLMKHCDWLKEDSVGIECVLFKKRQNK